MFKPSLRAVVQGRYTEDCNCFELNTPVRQRLGRIKWMEMEDGRISCATLRPASDQFISILIFLLRIRDSMSLDMLRYMFLTFSRPCWDGKTPEAVQVMNERLSDRALIYEFTRFKVQHKPLSYKEIMIFVDDPFCIHVWFRFMFGICDHFLYQPQFHGSVSKEL